MPQHNYCRTTDVLSWQTEMVTVKKQDCKGFLCEFKTIGDTDTGSRFNRGSEWQNVQLLCSFPTLPLNHRLAVLLTCVGTKDGYQQHSHIAWSTRC